MPIDTKHPQWIANIYSWTKVRDCVGGEKIIKSKNTKYLDMPAGMENIRAPSIGGTGTEQFVFGGNAAGGDQREYDPTWHSNPAYRAYLRRAKFPDISAFTLRGLVGLSVKKDYNLNVPDSLSYIEDSFTNDGKSLSEFYKFCLSEVIQTGRLVCVVEIVDNKFVVVPYLSESVINWEAGKYIVVEEKTLKDADDIYSHDTKPIYKVLYIDQITNLYSSAIAEEGSTELPISDSLINYAGKKINKIPAVVFGSTNNDYDVDQIPLEGIADCALNIYRKTADLSNAQYMSCNPTLVAIGVGQEDKPTALGSTVVWLIGNADAKVDYPKTDTSALQHVKEDIKDLFEEAANYGAQLLGSPKRGAEAAESIRLQQAASGATLSGIVDTVSQGITNLLKFMVEWSGGNTEDVSFQGSKEFADIVFSAQELTELRNSWMSGGISQETYLENMKRAGIVAEDEDIQDEIDRINMEGRNTNKTLNENPIVTAIKQYSGVQK